MLCKKCKTELSENAKFCSECGEQVPKQTGIKVKQEVDTVQGSVTGVAASDVKEIPGINADINQDIGTVEAGAGVAGLVVGGEGGNVHVGGQQNYGDQIGGDKISIGNVEGENVAIAAGREAEASVKTGLSSEALEKLFKVVYQQIEDRPADPDVDKEEITQTVQQVEVETAKGEEANPKKVDRWLKNLAAMAPDILKVTAATLANPAAGVATAIRLIAEKAKAESSAA
jgi:hypothetical protein